MRSTLGLSGGEINVDDIWNEIGGSQMGSTEVQWFGWLHFLQISVRLQAVWKVVLFR